MCYQIFWRMQKESLNFFASVLTSEFLLRLIADTPKLALFKSAYPVLNNAVTNFISFLLLVLTVEHVDARTGAMFFAGMLRVTFLSFLVISLHLSSAAGVPLIIAKRSGCSIIGRLSIFIGSFHVMPLLLFVLSCGCVDAEHYWWCSTCKSFVDVPISVIMVIVTFYSRFEWKISLAASKTKI